MADNEIDNEQPRSESSEQPDDVGTGAEPGADAGADAEAEVGVRFRRADADPSERADRGQATGEREFSLDREPEREFDASREGEGSIELAAIASFEALEGELDQPILPVRPIDDDEESEDDAEDADEADEADEADAASTGTLEEATEESGVDGDVETSALEAVTEDGAVVAGAAVAAADDRRPRRRRGGRGRKKETQPATFDTPKRSQLMVVNDSPGEECRIAILENGRLEQIFAERISTATNVGNIYKGKVVNVEAAIQAAFIDFGEGQNGFLHISDLHPQYFPGQERTETVGRKIPRRDRPPIQEALKRGQEVIVQVLKEGLGTKGPTLTSYISIPGRLLVMMPHMDRVGVSRKVEDEDQRREMRRILDSLELPEGCGFILRTAGFDRTKTELQRDALYLQRLWEAMERRMNSTGAPCTLYTESDLLVRTIRDVVDDSVEAIVVDSESAFNRARTFIQVVAPLNSPRLCYYDRQAPIFYAFGVEQQIEQIHSHKVPLPSGGALVIDQTEAMVTIDVNSGKSRSARDSETNAFNTNKEAVDEISRQLRLRDLGGIIVNDLIDMRSSRHRREIEERLQESLRRDRAKTTTLDISDFGIIEMTRQRMRPGLHKTHFMDCPHCHGSGEVRVPDAVAADCIRKAALLFCYDRVHRVEIVCSVRVASVLLSARRSTLSDLEERTGKRVDVRISETFGIDRVDIYAYDERGADIEAERLPRVPMPRIADLLAAPAVSVDDDDGDDGDDNGESGRGRGRRRRRRKPQPADATAMALAGNFDDLPTPSADEPSVSELIRRSDAERQARKAAELATRAADAAARLAAGESVDGEASLDGDGARASGDGVAGAADGEDGDRRRRRRRRGRGRGEGGGTRSREAGAGDGAAGDAAGGGGEAGAEGQDGVARGEAGEGAARTEGDDGGPRRRRRRRRGRGGRGGGGGGPGGSGASTDAGGEGTMSAGADGSSPESGEATGEGSGANAGTGESRDGDQGGEGGGRSRGRRRRRGGRGRRGGGSGGGGDEGGGRGGDGGGGGYDAPRPGPASSAPAAPPPPSAPAPESAAKKTIRSVTGWMRRLKGPAAGSRDDR